MGAKKRRLQIPITYEDVAVDFTQEEWECLTEKQKAVYQNVLSETFKNLTFVDQNTMQNGKGRRRSGFHPPKTAGHKRKSQKPSSNLEDEERDDEEKTSPACTGIFKGGPLYFCLTCGKCYKKYTNVVDHQYPLKAQQTTGHKALSSKPQNHRGRPFSCELCDKNYRDASGLSRHRRTHLGYRPSSCSVCGKRFRDQSEVKRHMKVHQNRKPVAGSQERKVKKAPRTSPRSQAPILRHSKVIQGPVARTKTRNSRASSLDVRSNPIPVRCSRRKIRCPYCSLRLTRKTYFLTHLKFHFKNQPSQYLSCRESSQSSVMVDSHRNTHRKQNIYCCPICDICFRGKESLLDHLCCKKSGRPIKCWAILGHLLGFLYEPLCLGNTSTVEESSEEEE